MRVSSPDVAEMAKLLENVFRSVNIALVNELAMLADRMGIDIYEVVDAAATKPFGFMRFDPGPGMGGHCLPVDPFYLSWRAREFDLTTEFIELAGKVNQQMPYYCASRVEEALNDLGLPVKGSRIAILGVSYKPGVGDVRESPALKIIGRLRDLGAEIVYHDEYVDELRAFDLRRRPARGGARRRARRGDRHGASGDRLRRRRGARSGGRPARRPARAARRRRAARGSRSRRTGGGRPALPAENEPLPERRLDAADERAAQPPLRVRRRAIRPRPRGCSPPRPTSALRVERARNDARVAGARDGRARAGRRRAARAADRRPGPPPQGPPAGRRSAESQPERSAPERARQLAIDLAVGGVPREQIGDELSAGHVQKARRRPPLAGEPCAAATPPSDDAGGGDLATVSAGSGPADDPGPGRQRRGARAPRRETDVRSAGGHAAGIALQTYGSQLAHGGPVARQRARSSRVHSGPTGRGEVAFLTAIAFLGSNLWTIGVQEANVNLAGSEPATRGALATNSLILSVLCGGVGALLMALLISSSRRPAPASAGSCCALILLSMPMLVLNSYLRFLIQGELRLRRDEPRLDRCRRSSTSRSTGRLAIFGDADRRHRRRHVGRRLRRWRRR